LKKLQKICALLLVTLVTLIPLTSCSAPKSTPEETTKVVLDILLKDDKSNISKIGLTDKYYKEIRDDVDTGIDKGFEQGLATGGVDKSVLTDDLKKELKKDILTGLSKIQYDVTKVSEDKKSAKVQIKAKGFDMNKIVETSKPKLLEKIKANKAMTEKEVYQESLKLAGEGMANGILVDTPKTYDLNLTKESNVWVPNSGDLTKLAMGIYGN
jgi:hypothetical protein